MPHTLALVALGIIALLAVACDDGDTTAASPTPPTAEEPTATPTAEPTPVTQAGGFPLTVTDTGGHELALESTPRRIVSHSPGATEILFAIGAGDLVVAVDEFSDYPPEAAERERVAYSDPDPERALELDPDLIILGGRQEGSVEQFRSLDLPVFYNGEAESIEALLENILTLGEVSGQTEEADTLVADIRERVEAVEAAIADVEQGPRVFWEITDDLYTAAPNTFIGDMLQILKVENIAAGAATQFPQLSSEAVIDANPEVILMADHEWVPVESVGERPGWDAIDAVVNDRVYPVDDDKSSRPGPRIVEALEEAAALLYPDRFE